MASACAALHDLHKEEFKFTAWGTWFDPGAESLPEESESSELCLDIWEGLLDAPGAVPENPVPMCSVGLGWREATLAVSASQHH